MSEELYHLKAKVPSVARGINKNIIFLKIFKKFLKTFFGICYLRDTPGFPNKMSAHSV